MAGIDDVKAALDEATKMLVEHRIIAAVLRRDVDANTRDLAEIKKQQLVDSANSGFTRGQMAILAGVACAVLMLLAKFWLEVPPPGAIGPDATAHEDADDGSGDTWESDATALDGEWGQL